MMDLSNYLFMQQELSLLFVFLLLFVYDLFAVGRAREAFLPVACGLFLLHLILGFAYPVFGTAFSGMYVNLPAENMMKNVLNIGVLLVFLQSGSWLASEDTVHKRDEFFTLVLLTLFGMYLMISARNFMLFFIGLETASLPLAALVAFDKYRHHSAEAGAKFILTAVFSSVIMLFGLSMLYAAAGTLYFDDIPAALTAVTPLTLMALVFVLVGVFFKLSLVPFHLWTADVYEGAPTNVTSYLSTISKGAAVFALMAILYKVFGAFVAEWQGVLWWLVVLSITVGNLFALRQDNFKRFLAFSSISQAGYIVLSVYAGSPEGMASSMYYILVYIMSNLAAFGVASVIENRTGRINISDYNGLYRTNPLLAVTLMIAVFSLGGIPPTAGFFSKFFVFMAAAKDGAYLLLFLALINTVISLYYYLMVVKAMFITPSDSPLPEVKTDVYARISLAVCLLGVFAIGFAAPIYSHFAQIAFGS